MTTPEGPDRRSLHHEAAHAVAAYACRIPILYIDVPIVVEARTFGARIRLAHCGNYHRWYDECFQALAGGWGEKVYDDTVGKQAIPYGIPSTCADIAGVTLYLNRIWGDSAMEPDCSAEEAKSPPDYYATNRVPRLMDSVFTLDSEVDDFFANGCHRQAVLALVSELKIGRRLCGKRATGILDNCKIESVDVPQWFKNDLLAANGFDWSDKIRQEAIEIQRAYAEKHPDYTADA